jgi:DNA polymerase II small subunit
MEKRILELLTSHGTLVSPETMEYIHSKDDPETYIQDVIGKFQEIPLYLTIEQLKEVEDKEEKTPIEASDDSNIMAQSGVSPTNAIKLSKIKKELSQKPAAEVTEPPKEEPARVSKSIAPKKIPVASEYDGDIQIIKDVTGESTSEGTIKDFNKYFQTRFQTMKKILFNHRREVRGSADIATVKGREGPLKFVGLVNDIRLTQKGHKIMELEDETDSVSVLINNNSPLINMNFVNDEVLCVIGKMGKNVADIHVGSTTFLHKPWEKFSKWLNGKHSINGSEELLDKLKYIVIAGDIVDGIGIYPNQEAELEIADIYAQYENLAIKFQEIPDHIQLIVQPGNHDAVRPAEPQPTFPTEITQLFSNDIRFVGNPCYFTINNVEVLAYHGRSMDDFVMQIPKVTYNTPIQIMKEMLLRRHLAPIYGQKTPISPEHLDYLLIDRIPDIFVTGHIHKTALEAYRDISLVNASAWQSQTSYQKMMNFNPDPAKAILADLQTMRLQILNFT